MNPDSCEIISRPTAPGGVGVLVVDIQADFTTAHQGSLAVNGADEVFLRAVRTAVEILLDAGLPLIATQDWHPADHTSLASANPGREVMSTKTMPDGREQIIWPDHCVQGTDGARLLIDTGRFQATVKKGVHPDWDSYSAFHDDGMRPTGLDDLLRELGVRTLIIFGLTTDYCVHFTVRHALEAGYGVVVIKDLCRAVDPGTGAAAWREMLDLGARIVDRLNMDAVNSLIGEELNNDRDK